MLFVSHCTDCELYLIQQLLWMLDAARCLWLDVE